MKKFFYSTIIAAAAMVGVSSCSNSVPTANLKSDLDSLGYAYGVAIGQQYSNFQDSGMVVPEVTMELDNFIAGLVTAIRRDSNNLKISVKDAQAFIQKFNQELSQKMEEKRLAEVADNKVKGADFMAENAKKDGVVTLESGLQIQVVEEGNGAQPKEDDKVKVAYKGTLIDGTVFDQNEEAIFGVNQVVPGFKEGLMNMKVGSKVILTMSSDLAYGDRGAGATIKGGSTLQFEVTLLSIEK